MTFLQLLSVSAAAIGLVIIAVMAAIPFLTDEPWAGDGRRRQITGGHPRP